LIPNESATAAITTAKIITVRIKTPKIKIRIMYPAIIEIQPAVLVMEVKDDNGIVKKRVFQIAYAEIAVSNAVGISIIAISPIFALGSAIVEMKTMGKLNAQRIAATRWPPKLLKIH
jgi:hypothetical protein